MGLSPGFIPLGLKEHGGIMYIASINKEGEGEIGTIPSPIIREFYKDKNRYLVESEIPFSGDPLLISHKLYPADKFIANSSMSIDHSTIKGHNMKYKESPLNTDGISSTDPSDLIL
jgi:hypothetical protein